MRILSVAIVALLLAACAAGPSVGSISYFQDISAQQIGGDIAPASIKIHDRRALIFTSYWTAVTPDGAYACSRDLAADACKPKR